MRQPARKPALPNAVSTPEILPRIGRLEKNKKRT
jgi:hypothetical protein